MLDDGSGEDVTESRARAIVDQIPDGGAVDAGHQVPLAGWRHGAVGFPRENASELEVLDVGREEPWRKGGLLRQGRVRRCVAPCHADGVEADVVGDVA